MDSVHTKHSLGNICGNTRLYINVVTHTNRVANLQYITMQVSIEL